MSWAIYQPGYDPKATSSCKNPQGYSIATESNCMQWSHEIGFRIIARGFASDEDAKDYMREHGMKMFNTFDPLNPNANF